MTRKIVSEMTYNVSMGTLNPTIPYHTCRIITLLSVSRVTRCDSVLSCRRVRKEYVSSLQRSGKSIDNTYITYISFQLICLINHSPNNNNNNNNNNRHNILLRSLSGQILRTLVITIVLQ